jgi:hypothetical protein
MISGPRRLVAPMTESGVTTHRVARMQQARGAQPS